MQAILEFRILNINGLYIYIHGVDIFDIVPEFAY